MKIIITLLYIFSGLLVLFEASKLIDTMIGEKISVLPVEQEKIKKINIHENILKEESLNSYISLVPLFTPPQKGTEVKENGKEIPESPLLRQYQLTGIIYLGEKNSLALIRKRGERESKLYRVNDTLGNATIIRIKKDRVILDYNGSTVILPMYYRPKNQALARSGRPSPALTGIEDQSYASARRIRKVLSRSDVENKVLKKVNQILTQIAISPYMRNGKMEGLRLVRVPKNNIVYELGGRSGDIIKRVNGHELNQIDQMYKLWENIKDDSVISVDLERNHQIYTYTFEIRE